MIRPTPKALIKAEHLSAFEINHLKDNNLLKSGMQIKVKYNTVNGDDGEEW
jgi:hypothetical protein